MATINKYGEIIVKLKINKDGSHEANINGVGVLVSKDFVATHGLAKAESFIAVIFKNSNEILNNFSLIKYDSYVRNNFDGLSAKQFRELLKIHSVLISESDENNFTNDKNNNSWATIWINTQGKLGSGFVSVDIKSDCLILT